MRGTLPQSLLRGHGQSARKARAKESERAREEKEGAREERETRERRERGGRGPEEGDEEAHGGGVEDGEGLQVRADDSPDHAPQLPQPPPRQALPRH
eukprot:2131296-Rhodomonas_salina.1